MSINRTHLPLKTFFTVTILVLSLVFVFSKFIDVGFSNWDDTTKYLSTIHGGIINDDGKIWSENQGRFYYYFVIPLSKLPYYFDDNIWLKSIQYIPVILSFLAFSIILSKNLKNNSIFILVLSFLLLLFSIPDSGFSPPIAYPLIFTGPFLLFLLSYFFFQLSLTNQSSVYQFIYLLLFTIAFFTYEAYFIIWIIFVFIIYIESQHESVLLKAVRLAPIILIGLIFYTIYFLYKNSLHDGVTANLYDGSNFAKNFNLNNAFKLVHNFNRNAYPGNIYLKNQNLFSSHDPLFKNNLFYLISKLSLANLLFSFTLPLLIVYHIIKYTNEKVERKKLVVILLILMCLSYGLNIVYSISEKYNSQFYTMNGYVTTYIAFFGISTSLLICIILLFSFIRSSVYKTIAAICTYLAMVVISIVINYSNLMIGNDWYFSQLRFNLINKMEERGEFASLPDNSIVLTNELYATKSILGQGVCTGDFSWENYLSGKCANKTIQFVRTTDFKSMLLQKSDSNIYFIGKVESLESNCGVITLSKIDNDKLFNTSEMKIYLFNPYQNKLKLCIKIDNETNYLSIDYDMLNKLDFSRENSGDFMIIDKAISAISLKNKNLEPKSLRIQ